MVLELSGVGIPMGAALAVMAGLALALLHHVVLGHGGGWVSAAAEEERRREEADRTLTPRPLTLLYCLKIRVGTPVCSAA